LVTAVLAGEGAVRLYIDGRLETSGDGLDPQAQSLQPDRRERQVRAQNFVGRWMRPDQSTALHASLLSLTMSDGER
jgi:hypothetical protein